MSLRAAIIVIISTTCCGAFAATQSRAGARQQMSLESAVQQVQQQTDGRILAADSIPNGRNKLYRIKVLTPDGHVRVMQLHSNDAPANAGGKQDKDKKRSGTGH